MQKLYLIYARTLGRVKIGLSKDPLKRLKQLQTGSPVELELFAFKNCRNANIKESQLHERFQSKCISGEWFELTPRDYVDLLREWDFDPGLHYSQRTIEVLAVGDIAYISFDSRALYRVRILKYDREENSASVEILEVIGRGRARVGNVYGLYADEVRKDPIDALVNRVTM